MVSCGRFSANRAWSKVMPVTDESLVSGTSTTVRPSRAPFATVTSRRVAARCLVPFSNGCSSVSLLDTRSRGSAAGGGPEERRHPGRGGRLQVSVVRARPQSGEEGGRARLEPGREPIEQVEAAVAGGRLDRGPRLAQSTRLGVD